MFLPWSCFSTLLSSSRIEEISCRKEEKKKRSAPLKFCSFHMKYCSYRRVSVPCWRFSEVVCHSLIAVCFRSRPSSCPYPWTISWRKQDTHVHSHCKYTVIYLSDGYNVTKYNYLIFPAVLSTECLIFVDSWETELSRRLSNTAWTHREAKKWSLTWWPEGDCDF